MQEEINIRITAPDSYQERFYQKDICDYWDETGFYFHPSPTIRNVLSQGAEVKDRTDSGSAFLHISLNLILICTLLTIFIKYQLMWLVLLLGFHFILFQNPYSMKSLFGNPCGPGKKRNSENELSSPYVSKYKSLLVNGLLTPCVLIAILVT